MTAVASLAGTPTRHRLLFLPVATFSRLDRTNYGLEGNRHPACVLDELVNDLLLCLLLCEDVHHGLLEILSFRLHLKTDLEALDFGLSCDSCVQLLEASTHTHEQRVVFNLE